MNPDEMLEAFRSLTDENSRPRTNSVSEMLRDMSALRWNSKVFGHQLAESYFKTGGAQPAASLNNAFELGWKATTFEDFQQAWFFDACRKLHVAPVLHRKLWEEAYLVKTLELTDKLRPGTRGIGFGCGEEAFPSYFSSLGSEVVATDLDPGSREAAGWIATKQHANLERLYKPSLVSKDQFEKNVSFQYADMNDISSDLEGKFDYCWSVCAFEHLGSIEAGLRFVERSCQLLKPGGVAIHTTEFNYSNNVETIDNWGTVLFRRQDFEALASRLREQGFLVPSISFDVGQSPVDWFIDVPPYPGEKNYYSESLRALHLKLMVDGFPSTCYGITVQRPH